MFRKVLALLMFVIGAGLIPAQIQYAKKTTEIHAGVLLVDSWRLYGASSYYAYDGNGEPFVWYNLDQSTAVKPSGWTFVNPHGNTTMTPEMTNRWSAIQANVGGSIAPLDSVLTKADAPYWEVRLNTSSDSQLADFDILSMSIRGDLSLLPGEREKLHAFMDQGGILWVDIDQNTNIDAINNVPFAVDKSVSAGGPINADTSHPLLSRPNQITLAQVASMESDSSGGLVAVDPANYGAAGIAPILETLAPEFNKIQDVASDSSGVLLGVVKVGNGFMVVTARGVGTTLNRGKGGAGNPDNDQFYAAKPSLDEGSNAAARLIVNALHLGGSYNESFVSSRKTSASAVDLHAPLLRQFYSSLTLSAANHTYVPPSTYKGLFVISAFDRIYVYDGNPSKDLNGDGNPDDGVPDTDLSSGLDLLWVSAALPGPISSPTCVQIDNAAGSIPIDQILVVDSTGAVHGFDAFAFENPSVPDLNNVADAYPAVSAPVSPADYDMTADGHGPYAPTIHENIAYIADTQSGVTGRVGRVWLFDPATATTVQSGTAPWVVGGSTSSGLPEVTGPPTIGYIPIQDNSGGQDLVAYLPTRANPTALGSPDSTAGITSMWLGVKGEKPQSVTVSGSTIEIVTRANLAGLKIYQGLGNDPLGIKISVFRSASGIPLTASEMAGLFNGTITQGPDGILDLGLVGPWDPDYSVRIDYRIDWGSGSLTLTDQTRRGSLFFPDAGRTRRVLGALALGPNGNIFAAVSDQTRGGALYAFREEGRGLFRMLYRYELYDAHTITLSSAAAVDYRETFVNDDPVTSVLGADFQGPLTNLTLQGAPSIRNGLVFSTATATVGPNSIPVTILMAFKEDPEPVKIPVGNVGDNFVIVQPDIARSVNPSNPEVFTLTQPSQFTYEAAGDNGFISMDNLMASKTGQIQQALSSSQGIIVRQSGQADKLIEPDAVGGRWSPLTWFTVLEGTSTSSPPIVTGNTVFVAGNSKLPDILGGTLVTAAADRGVMFAMDADVQPLPPDAYPNSVRPWMYQVPVITFSGSTVVPSEAIRWPQTSGVKSFEDWKARYLQTALRVGDTTFGLAAGDGALFTWGPSTVYGFNRGDLMVADESRLIRLDASGNPLWSADLSSGSGSSAQNTNSSTVHGLVRPVRAYRLGEDQVVVADPAANRIIRMNYAGKEIRSISSFQVDSTYKPDGYVAGSPTMLNAPSDIATYSTYVAAPQNFLSGPSALEYWVYYLVADLGNKRLLEIVDRYQADPTTREILNPVVDGLGNKQLGVLTWYSPANYTGKQFRYNSVARVFNPATSKFIYAGGIGNATPTSADLGLSSAATTSTREANGGNGGVVLFDGSNTVAINSFRMPAINANVYYNDTTQTFNSPAQVTRMKSIGNVTSVTMRYVTYLDDPDPNKRFRLAVMFTDSSGVFEVYQPDQDPTLPPDPSHEWKVRWMLPREMYKSMRRDTSNIATGENPRDLYATFARRLDSGEVIVVNGYLGKTRAANPFTGEVMLVDGDFDVSATNTLPGFDFAKQNFGFSSLSIRLQLSQLSGIRNINAPVFADLK